MFAADAHDSTLEQSAVHDLRLPRSVYFHAVEEASKSVADKLRTKSGSLNYGVELAEQVLDLGGTGLPILAFNSLRTLSETSEQGAYSI